MKPVHCVALLAAAMLACTGTAKAVQPAPAASTATAATLAKPVVARPEADAETDKTIAAMNSASTWGHPDLFGEYAGMRLYSEGHYKAAIKYFKYGARYADKLSQLSIGLMYANGRGVEKDPVTACAWLALAAERKYASFIATRNRVCEALTPAQHDQAVAVLDKLMPIYGDKVAKRRMTTALNLAKMQSTGSHLGFDAGITTIGVNQNCSARTMANSRAGVGGPVAGCGSSDFWSPWRWDPKKYFATRDAHWTGTVTVGDLKNVAAPATSAKATPASASSSGH
jgi:hypothetical protein